LAFLKKSAPQADVLVADLSADGRDIQRTRRLTLDDRDDYPTGWTHDSAAVLFCSDRNGNFDIFKQTLDRHSPEPIVATSKDERGPAAITPDGAWYIYFRIPDNPTGKLEPNTWMRVPTGGGASHPVLEKPVFGEISCARAPSDLCVLSDVDRSEIRFYALHPVKGRGRELARVDSGPDLWTRWSISPDGKRIGIARNDRIQVITLDAHSVSGNSTVDLFTPGWKDLSGLAWSADSRGFYISVGSTHAMTLLSVSLGGAVRKMWESTGQAARLVTASPDGRRLAFTKWNAAQNVWLIANF
jgi:Tol biopolymer transport system component